MRRLDFLTEPDERMWASFAHCRATAPVLWAEPIHMFCVFGHRAIQTCLTSSDYTVEYPFRVSAQVFGRTLLDMDGPEQTRLRKVLGGLLVGRADNVPFAGIVDTAVAEVLDGLDDAGETAGVDFVERVGRGLPAMVTARFLGIPESERGWVFGHLRYLLDHLDGSSRDFAVATRLRREVADLAARLIADGGAPEGTVLARLRAEVAAGALGVADAVGLVLLVLAAGVETSTGLLSNTMATLARFPHLRPADADGVARFVREVARWEPPQTDTVRFARRDTVLDGVDIPGGSALKLVLASGNRDEAVFVDGEVFDPDRPARPSLSFGHGPHSCLGTHVALGVATGFFTAFLARFPDAAVVGPVPQIQGWTFRAPAALTVSTGGRAA
ncbi:cytochrome P450 [Actinokineospora sp. 24-640]